LDRTAGRRRRIAPHSIETRIKAAAAHREATGITPQLVYGDLTELKFPRLKGYKFPYLCRELCLCQTSTIMLGAESIPHFPISTNGYNTDDEIALTIGKRFHVLHCGSDVAVYHSRASQPRMSNNPRKIFEGVRDLVREHRGDILCR
jgi:hypothetical protein